MKREISQDILIGLFFITLGSMFGISLNGIFLICSGDWLGVIFTFAVLIVLSLIAHTIYKILPR